MKRIFVLVAAVFVVAGVVLWTGLHWDWAWLAPLGRWSDTFIRSAGFGALAALTAAAIAYRGVTRRIDADRELELKRQGEAVVASERDRRWEMIMWVYSNIDSADPRHMVAVCEELAAEVEPGIEARMLAAIVDQRLNEERARRRRWRR